MHNPSKGCSAARFKFLLLLAAALFAPTAAVLAADDAMRVEKRGEFEFSIAPVPAWIVPHDVPESWEAKAPGEDERGWRNWLADAQVDRRGAHRVAYYDLAIEPRSSELVGEAAKMQLSFVPEYQKLTLHRVAVRRDGRWLDRLRPESITLARRESEFEDDMATGEVTALSVIEDVRAGDIVRVSYSIAGSNPVMRGFDDEYLRFSWTSPLLDRHARILYPAGTRLATSSRSGAPDARVRAMDDRVEMTAHAHALAGVRDDGDYPAWYSPWAVLQVGRERSWADVAAWAGALYPAPSALPADLEERIAQWRELDRDAGIAAALRAVQEDVRYFGTELGESTHRPAEPAETWRRRYGDCKDKARLLAVVLGAMDVQAEPALVSAQRGRGVRDELPAASAFDHVIVRVRDGKRTLWLDPTMTQQRGPLAGISVSDFGVALPVGAGATGLVAIERTAPEPMKHVRERWQPSADGATVDLTITTSVTGALADGMRRAIAGAGTREMGQQFTEYYRRTFGDLEVVEALAASDDESANRIETIERYRLLQPWAAQTAAQRAIDVYAESIGVLVAMPGSIERNAPLGLGAPIAVEHDVEVALPSGWTLPVAIEPVRVTDKGISFERKISPAEDLVVIGQRFAQTSSDVAVADLRAHLGARRRIVDATSFRLVFELPSRQAAPRREQRVQQLLRGIIDEREERQRKHAGSRR